MQYGRLDCNCTHYSGNCGIFARFSCFVAVVTCRCRLLLLLTVITAIIVCCLLSLLAIVAYVCLSLFNTQTCSSVASAMSFAVRFGNRFALSPAVRSMHLPTAARCLSSYLLFTRHSRPMLIRCLFPGDRYRYSLPAVAIRHSPLAVCCLLFVPVADISLPALAIRYPLSCYLPPSPVENVFFHFLLSFRVTSPESGRRCAVAAGGGMLIASGRLSACVARGFAKESFA